MHLSMLSPRGEGPQAYVGHLASIAFPILWNLTKSMDSRVETFDFFVWRNGWDLVTLLRVLVCAAPPSWNVSNKCCYGGKHLFSMNKTSSSL